MDFNDRYNAVLIAVYRVWMNNGEGLSEAEAMERLKTMQDAVTNSYIADMSAAEWTKAALARL